MISAEDNSKANWIHFYSGLTGASWLLFRLCLRNTFTYLHIYLLKLTGAIRNLKRSYKRSFGWRQREDRSIGREKRTRPNSRDPGGDQLIPGADWIDERRHVVTRVLTHSLSCPEIPQQPVAIYQGAPLSPNIAGGDDSPPTKYDSILTLANVASWLDHCNSLLPGFDLSA